MSMYRFPTRSFHWIWKEVNSRSRWEETLKPPWVIGLFLAEQLRPWGDALLKNTSCPFIHNTVDVCMYSVTSISPLSTIWQDHNMPAITTVFGNQYGCYIAWWKGPSGATKELCGGNWRMLRINVFSIGCAGHRVLCWWINDEEEEGSCPAELVSLGQLSVHADR